MHKVQEILGLGGAVIGMFAALAGLFAWAFWQDSIEFVVRLFSPARADALAEEHSRKFRQLCNVPEPGCGWD
jgi:hypothetical protein